MQDRSNGGIIVTSYHPSAVTPTVASNPADIQAQHWTVQWTAHPKFFRTPNKTTFARCRFDLAGIPEKAILRVAGDDSFKLRVNGTEVGSGSNHAHVFEFDIKKLLLEGRNEIFFELYNITGPCGLIYELDAMVQGKSLLFASGQTTEFSEDGKSNWTAPFLAGTPPVAPWGPLTVRIKAN